MAGGPAGTRALVGSQGGDATAPPPPGTIAKETPKVPSRSDGGLATRTDAGGGAATRNEDAVPLVRRSVELPSDLKRRRYSARVLVQVNIEADGRHTETLVQGSGDRDVDTEVLRALAGWRWEAAFRDGVRVRSTRKFEYRIRVED